MAVFENLSHPYHFVFDIITLSCYVSLGIGAGGRGMFHISTITPLIIVMQSTKLAGSYKITTIGYTLLFPVVKKTKIIKQ